MGSKLDEILANIRAFSGITDDSRNVRKGYVFVAIKGLNSDGHEFIGQARKSGARVVVGERGDVDVKVPDSRKALSLLASAYYGDPSKKLRIIGVTGTDGKTTTANLIYWILKTAGEKVGLVSTVSAKIGDREFDTGFHVTSPEPMLLQKFLAEMVKEKCEYAVLEVTSHGLSQDRVYGVNFEIGVLTNITHEHLDYHKTFQNYVEAKEKLFMGSKTAILNEKYGKLIKSKGKRILYGEETLVGGLKKVVLERFQEPYNTLNATAAILTAKEFGIDDAKIVDAIKTFPGIEGRMQEIKNTRGIRIIIDFAHTPNALENVLSVLRKKTPRHKKLIAVFGCAGERDVQKRPMMANISTNLADISVFTAEDPRSESIDGIIGQMVSGIKNKKAEFYKISDRDQAITTAINKLAKAGDTVVLCGKGHEKSMNIGGVEYPWSDRLAAESALIRRVHFMGIGGSGIAGVAALASKMGYEVSGCDISGESAYQKNISWGHDKAHVLGADLVVVSPAVFYQNNNHPEVVEARRQEKLITWQEFLGKYLVRGKRVISVAGTHGKSTTTAMAGKLLTDAGLDPTVVVGAVVPEWKGNSRSGKGDYFVVESDEFYDNFLHFHPEIIILNNIEFDHPDYFKNEEQVFDSFSKFVENLVGQKMLIYNEDSQGVKRLLGRIEPSKIHEVGYSLKNIGLQFKLQVAGRHNIANALGVVKLGRALGIKDETIKRSLEGFKGIGRRMELIHEKGGMLVYDDYAHHPTAIAATLQAVREMHPKARIWAVDEPHGFARTKALLENYLNVFDDANKVLIGPIFRARDKGTFGMTPQKVVSASKHGDALAFDDFESLKNYISRNIKKGDIVLVMGAGKSYIWAKEIAEAVLRS